MDVLIRETKILADMLKWAAPMLKGQHTGVSPLGWVSIHADGGDCLGCDRLVAAVTDFDVTICADLDDVEVSEPGTVAVYARELASALKGCGTGSLRIRANEQRTYLEDSRGTTVVEFTEAFDLPRPANDSLGAVALSDWRRLLRTAATCSTDETRMKLNGAYLKLDDTSISATSTDGHKLTHVEACKWLGPQWDGIVHRIGMQVLERWAKAKWLPDKIMLRGGDHRFEVEAGPISVVVRCIADTYPNYTRVIPSKADLPVRFAVDAKDFAKQMQRVGKGRKGCGVRVSLSGGQLMLTEHTDVGVTNSATVPVTDAEGELKLALNWRYVRDLIKVSGAETLRVYARNDRTGVLFEDPDDDDAYYIIMPMMYEAPA